MARALREAKTQRTFERALILNCGNGWVERELLASGLIREAVGIDYGEELLQEARAAAAENGLPLTYVRANINDGVFPEGEFDLVVNHAAAHHIAAIDRVFREICRILPEDGWFVSYDYVGPHRNQYEPAAWEAAWSLNGELPASLRQDLQYPHLPTMLVTDPTEAIHSELIVETMHRYFTVSEFTPLGGALAYPLLTHNGRLFESDDPAERAAWVDRIMEADDRFLAEHPGSTLFAYFAGTPDKSVLAETERLSRVGGRGIGAGAAGGEGGGRVLRPWRALERVDRTRRRPPGAGEGGGEGGGPGVAGGGPPGGPPVRRHPIRSPTPTPCGGSGGTASSGRPSAGRAPPCAGEAPAGARPGSARLRSRRSIAAGGTRRRPRQWRRGASRSPT